MARLHRRFPAVAVALVVAAAAVLVATPAAAQGADDGDAPAYRNHTVGETHGWFFDAKTNTSSGNYSDWANGETFYLGDYLIFKTNDNSSVVHTTNATSYSLCDASEDDSPETFIYGGGGGGGGGPEEGRTVPVALVEEGSNYFFSEADAGVQCQQGMRFEIKVQHGQGLPPSLKNPPPAPKGRVLAPPPDGTAFSGTGMVEPGNGAGDNGGEGSDGAPGAPAGRFLGVAALGVAAAVFMSL
ncbi:hypothetical protein PR202_ga12495 [Eleusine coracana subsp. coracana]|uniref:Phytocyanin domain-containing protein n=1 Tax=Eleusine coracana subsp. coracana TaxID=191504 RepID=A0AAV5CBR6_ELECO|nr:hypothetical protein PR202_ga12495 [Eleusine coracana subsp. coracana]